jgi:hypothetical protein
VKVEHPPALREHVEQALHTGPARVDQVLFDPNVVPLLCVRHPVDGAYLWLTYRPDDAATWVTAVQPPHGVRQAVSGTGVDGTGFRLFGPATSLTFELFALAHRPMTVVRGRTADFADAQPDGRDAVPG